MHINATRNSCTLIKPSGDRLVAVMITVAILFMGAVSTSLRPLPSKFPSDPVLSNFFLSSRDRESLALSSKLNKDFHS